MAAGARSALGLGTRLMTAFDARCKSSCSASRGLPFFAELVPTSTNTAASASRSSTSSNTPSGLSPANAVDAEYGTAELDLFPLGRGGVRGGPFGTRGRAVIVDEAPARNEAAGFLPLRRRALTSAASRAAAIASCASSCRAAATAAATAIEIACSSCPCFQRVRLEKSGERQGGVSASDPLLALAVALQPLLALAVALPQMPPLLRHS